MPSFANVYRVLNLLSIDVALGSVCSALFFSKVFRVSLLPYALTVLAITVWVIYTVDHLLDARKVSAPASTERHQFHQRNFAVLARVVLIAIVVNGVLIFFIRKPVLVGGIYLISAVGVYLLVQPYLKVSKEIVIALLYTLGVTLPSLAVTDIARQEWPWTLLVQFFLTALTNLILFAWFDRENDRKDKRGSFVVSLGEKNTVSIIWILLILSVTLTFTSGTGASYFILAGDLILLIIFAGRSFFERHDRFRLLGDAIFFIPLVYWLT
jgi:4-hydroxybenzoate polyprenyltransferase